MAFFNALAIEIQALAAGILILFIITLLEIIDLQRGKKQHRQDLSAIDSGIALKRKDRLVSLFTLILEFLFGFGACGGFIYLAIALVAMEQPLLAASGGAAALIALTVPFIIWLSCRKAVTETADTFEAAERRRQTAARVQEPAQSAAAVSEPSISADDVLASAIAEPTPVPPALVQTLAPSAPAKPHEDARPTDSMLRRHYDAMVAAQSAEEAQPAADASAKTCGKCCHHTVKIPEDSMLRRHYLSALQVKIEAHLKLPARPTDSMLKRHYDTMKAELIAARMGKYLP